MSNKPRKPGQYGEWHHSWPYPDSDEGMMDDNWNDRVQRVAESTIKAFAALGQSFSRAAHHLTESWNHVVLEIELTPEQRLEEVSNQERRG